MVELKRALCVLVVGGVLALPSLAQAQEPLTYPDGVVAVVDGLPITRYELELSCQLRNDYRDLTPGSSARLRIQFLELQELVKQKVLLRRAQKDEIKFSTSDKKRLNLELARQARDYGGVEGLKQALKKIGVPITYYVARQRDNILVSKLLVKKISRDIFVTPAEIRRHYKQHQGKYKRPGLTRLRQIVIYPDPDDAVRTPAAVKKRLKQKKAWDHRAFAKQVLKRIAAKKQPFKKIALDYSMGIKADEEMVIQSSLSLDEVLEQPLGEHIDALKPGEVSQVIETVKGKLYIVLLVDRREPGALPMEEVQRQIEAELKEKIWQRRLKQWIDRLLKDSLFHIYLPKPKGFGKAPRKSSGQKKAK